MRISSLFTYGTGVALAAAVIAGCSNGGSAAFGPPQSGLPNHQTSVKSTSTLLAMTLLAKTGISQHGERATASMTQTVHRATGSGSIPCDPSSPDWPFCQYLVKAINWPGFVSWLCCLTRAPIVTASDLVDNQVLEYASSLNTLTGFNDPYGQCVDKKGDTWIANFGGESVDLYAYGGTEPISSLSTDGYSIGCSVSPTGDLAVANFSGVSGNGNIQVFKNASGPPTEYSNENDEYLWPPGYDDKGNLFVEAETSSGVGVAELPAGGSSLAPVSLNQVIYAPGSVMWDGKYVTLTDQDAGGNPSSPATTIYQMKETGSRSLTVVGSTSLQDNCNGSQVDVVQPFIAGKKNTPINKKQAEVVIGGNLSCENQLDVWAYPAGGEPAATVNPAPAYVYGQAVSFK